MKRSNKILIALGILVIGVIATGGVLPFGPEGILLLTLFFFVYLFYRVCKFVVLSLYRHFN